jgi:hypothetical protein
MEVASSFNDSSLKLLWVETVYFNRFYLKLNNITNHFVGIFIVY